MFYLENCRNEALKLNKGNYEELINLTEICIKELQWWQKKIGSVNDIYDPLPQLIILIIYSDACPNGWREGRGVTFGKHSSGKNWSKEELYLHINVLEMAVSFFAVKTYEATLSDTSIHLRVDNTATLGLINR